MHLVGRYFKVKREDAYSGLRDIKVRVPQGSVLEPILNLLIPVIDLLSECKDNTVLTFVDDTATLAVGSSDKEDRNKLQTSINQIQIWTKNGVSNLNELKSVGINFTNSRF